MNLSELTLERDSLIAALESDDAAFEQQLREEAFRTKVKNVGETVYLRGLVEISNICAKNCLYCGIRREIPCPRYELSEDQVLDAARYALQNRFGSIVIQGGERSDAAFTRKIRRLLEMIKALEPEHEGDPPLGITLSLGEQPREVYGEWFEAGAHRYLLRMEATNPDLYRKIHPEDGNHSYDRRLEALHTLKELGYQAGTGAMIGLPFQTAADLADDLLFYRAFDAPMVGMGPYVPHPETPLTRAKAPFPTAEKRLSLGLKMIALLRLLMPDINIASTTALEALHPHGKELGILSGANVIMPNITPEDARAKYNLYDRKALLSVGMQPGDGAIPIGYGQWGDSRHFRKK